MAPTTPASHKFLPLMLNKNPKPKLERNEEIPDFKITYNIFLFLYIQKYITKPAPTAMATAHRKASAALATPET